jgi:predicted RND superfamily exporter protein
MLYATQTTVTVPALMGAIMCIGVATSNSILLVTFANDQRREGHDAQSAALTAGATRLRPVLMTALAMILGMLPMSLGLGEGGEQNAPLGRAVIGGLLVATVFTLFFVPVMYSLLRRTPPAPEVPEEEDFTELAIESGTLLHSSPTSTGGRNGSSGNGRVDARNTDSSHREDRP